MPTPLQKRRFLRKAAAAAAPPGFNPSDYGTVISHHDASDSSTVTDSSGVSEFRSKIGTRTFAQSDPGLRPTYSLSAVNGRNAILFNGVDQKLVQSGFAISQPFTVFVVIRPTSTAGFQVFWDSQSPRCSLFSSSGTALWYHAGSNQSASATVSANANHIVTAIFNGASSALRFNKSDISTANPGSNGTGGNLTIGHGDASFPYSGYYCESIVYEGALSGPNIASVETELSLKWSTV